MFWSAKSYPSIKDYRHSLQRDSWIEFLIEGGDFYMEWLVMNPKDKQSPIAMDLGWQRLSIHKIIDPDY
ncbi:uncharacterized protein PHALS_06814 [Plasmopara halstedii]|uniref:Uncharacterized protein n=1 Tax=Plasmopara halstedii TaxID=4781 RepID=A0A0P1B4Q7_PLAHL|nr:uncharacterized protein PHALS_06814 [Plasmopara halstedii]CEG49024.1 hypothetical protein PHALS_06814 [Plasmopara halstedii]|eukprot:XP_024585393.1 hypothetical protein PHALS_06814 [Plasmopara halstedii]